MDDPLSSTGAFPGHCTVGNVYLPMVSLLIGAVSAIVSGTLGILNCLKGSQHADPRHQRLSRLQIGLIVIVTLLTVGMLYHQDRSAASSAGRLSQMTEDLEKTLAMMYRQEILRSISIEIEPRGCLPQPLPAGAVQVPMSARDLQGLVQLLTGRGLPPRQTAVFQMFMRYGPLWILLLGRASTDGETWAYSLGSGPLPPDSAIVVAPMPMAPNQNWRTRLVEVQLNEGHIKPFIPNPPTAADIIMARPFMTADTFDPRTEMGYIQLPYLGLYRGSIPIAGQVPSGVFSDRERWRPIEIPFDYFQCWDVRIGLNGRHLENIMSRDSMLASIGDRITHWKGYGKMLPPDLHRGLVWLGPWPQEWSELRSFMNCRVSWLIYQDSPSPCPAALRVRSPSRTPRLR